MGQLNAVVKEEGRIETKQPLLMAGVREK